MKIVTTTDSRPVTKYPDNESAFFHKLENMDGSLAKIRQSMVQP